MQSNHMVGVEQVGWLSNQLIADRIQRMAWQILGTGDRFKRHILIRFGGVQIQEMVLRRDIQSYDIATKTSKWRRI